MEVGVQGNGLSIERRVVSCGTWFGLRGELDLALVGGAETWLESEVGAGTGDVVIDLSAVEFIGFAGVGLLDALARRLAAGGRRLLLAASNPVVDRVLALAEWSGDRPAVMPPDGEVGGSSPAAALAGR